MPCHDSGELVSQTIANRDRCVAFWRHGKLNEPNYGNSCGKIGSSRLKLHLAVELVTVLVRRLAATEYTN